MMNEPKVVELVDLELETVAAGKAPGGAGVSAGSFQKGGSAQKKSSGGASAGSFQKGGSAQKKRV